MNDLDLLTFQFFDDYYPLYVWIITVIVMHLLFIIFPRFRLTKKQWIKFDYLYYLLATMSLIGIISNAERYSINHDIESIFDKGYHTYEQKLNGIERNINTLTSFCKRNFQENNKTSEKFVKYENYLNLTKKIIKKLRKDETKRLKYLLHNYKGNNYLNYIIYPSTNQLVRIDNNNTKQKFIYVSDRYEKFLAVNNPFLNEIHGKNICLDIVNPKYKEFCNLYWLEEVQYFNRSLYYLYESYIELAYLLEKSKGEDLKFFLLFFVPYLLAFILGIRISKVSAELVGFKE